MPVFEVGCTSCNSITEHYLPHSDSPNPPCEECGGPTVRMISRFGVVFTGNFSMKYVDKKIDGYEAQADGHYGFERDGSPTWISDFQSQREFCKRNGFINPKDIGPAEVSSDGKKTSSRGLPGQWV